MFECALRSIVCCGRVPVKFIKGYNGMFGGELGCCKKVFFDVIFFEVVRALCWPRY